MFEKLSTIALTGSLLLLNSTTLAFAATPTAVQSVSVAQPQPPAQRPTNRPNRPTAPSNRELPTPIPSYDAAAMITTFAEEYLGVEPSVIRAVGVSGDLLLPPVVQAEVEATVALAGQVSVGAIRIAEHGGGAEVAVGTGTISGDLEADINAASLGTYGLVLPQQSLPTDEAAARALLLTTYPGLANAELERVSTEQGYVFKAVTTVQHFDSETMTLMKTAQVVIAGVNGKEQATAVWTVIGNGDFATALADLFEIPS